MDLLNPGRVLQVNGGSTEAKVDYAYGLFEKPVSVNELFEQDEMIDTIAITKGRGTEGVVTRWGVSRLPRKTHRGLRKVLHACSILRQLPSPGWWCSLRGPRASSSSLLLSAFGGDKRWECAVLVLKAAAPALSPCVALGEKLTRHCTSCRLPASAPGIQRECPGR